MASSLKHWVSNSCSFWQWTVEAEFDNGVIERETLNVPFSVIPESPIGIVALMGSSLAALGGFMFWTGPFLNCMNVYPIQNMTNDASNSLFI